MKQIHIKILMSIQKYLEENPNIRFGQALWNLNLLNWTTCSTQSCPLSVIDDPHAKSDEQILNLIKNATSKKNK